MNKSLLVAIAIESNKRTPSMGTRPSEEDVIAWAEGKISSPEAARVKHWVAHDAWTQSVYEDFMYYEDEPATLLRAAATTVSPDPQPAAPRDQNWYASVWERVSLLVFPATGRNWVAGAFVCMTALGLFLYAFLPSTPPVGLADYVQMADNPAENWRFQAALDSAVGSSPSTRDIPPKSSYGTTAFLFGIRSALQSIGISGHATVSVYYDSLPKAYPLCEPGANLCEQSNSWHYDLGQWVVLTERACNTSLATTDRESVLASQASVLATLSTAVTEKSLSVDESLQVLLKPGNRPTLCPLAESIFQWSAS